MNKATYEKEHKRIILALARAEDNKDYEKQEELSRELLELDNQFYGE